MWRIDGPRQVEVVPVASLMDERDGRYGVYELFAETGQLLYVGRTQNIRARLQSHERTQQWWPLVEFAQWTPVDNYGEAVALERHAIETDGALFNQVSTKQLQQSRQVLPDAEQHELMALYEDGASSASVDLYMKALHSAGWTLAAIGRPVGLTRERVRQRIARVMIDPDIAVTPYSKPQKSSKPKPALSPEERQELRRLQPLATRCRGRHAAGAPERVASERVTEIVVEARMRGVSRKEIGAALGVTAEAVTQRLKNHGFLATAPSHTAYGAGYTPKSECIRGHSLTEDNVQRLATQPGTRICKECQRIRARRYQNSLKLQRGAA